MNAQTNADARSALDDCPNCTDLRDRLRIQAATNRALIVECDRLRSHVLGFALKEFTDAPAIDLRVKAEMTGGL